LLHWQLHEAQLIAGLPNVPVTLMVEAVLDPADVVRRLSAASALLLVRDSICSRRDSDDGRYYLWFAGWCFLWFRNSSTDYPSGTRPAHPRRSP
jgi:hypothetical protein